LFRNKPLLPKQLRDAAIRDAHGGPSGLHFGVRRTAALIRRSADWPGLLGDVANFVRSCTICEQTRMPAPAGQPLQPIADPGHAGHTRCIDVAGPFPKTAQNQRYLLIIVDVSSRRLFAFPIVRATTKSMVKALLDHFEQAGLPAVLVADNARAFTSHEFQRFCSKHRIQLRHPTPYRPRANGIVERAVRTIKDQLRAFALQFPSQVQNWANHVPSIIAAYNDTPHRNTSMAPNHLWHASQSDMAVAMHRSQARRMTDRLRHRHPRAAAPLPTGTKVYRRLHHPRASDPAGSLRPRWDGPFNVLSFIPPTTYTIGDPARPSRIFTYHRDALRPAMAASPNNGGHVGDL
jgi:transposase InsO family protein